METFNYSPDSTLKLKKTPEKIPFKFGDGYKQRIGIGATPPRQEYSVTFTRGTDEIDAIDAFLSARNGYEDFLWTTPSGEELQFFCEQWNKSEADWNNISLTATFSQR